MNNDVSGQCEIVNAKRVSVVANGRTILMRGGKKGSFNRKGNERMGRMKKVNETPLI